MPYVPPPEGIESDLERTREYAHLIPENIREKITSDQAIEMRTIDLLQPFEPPIRQPEKCAWVKPSGTIPDDPLIHECLLAYSSDFGLLGTSMRPHGASVTQKHMQVASLDHAMWFHRDIRMDDWILYSMESPSASSSRGFNRGHFFSRDGVLLASVTQEGLIRSHKKDL
jgi:acyl-CoA thioesterase-2